MAKLITFDLDRCSDKISCLFDDGKEITVNPGYGPGFWCRVIDKLKESGYAVKLEDFGPSIEALYYNYRSQELKGDKAKQERLGFFECPKCGLVSAKHNFRYFDPCDNCRMTAMKDD